MVDHELFLDLNNVITLHLEELKLTDHCNLQMEVIASFSKDLVVHCVLSL